MLQPNLQRENHRERREERREALQERRNHGGLLGGHHDDRDRYDDGGYGRGQGQGYDQGQGYGGQGYGQDQGYGYGSQQRRSDRDTYEDDGPRRPQGFGGGYVPPSGPPPGRTSGFGTQGGLDRGDFATDEDIQRMVTSGELGGRPGGRQGHAYDRDGEGGYGGTGRGGGGGGDRYGAPPGPPPGQGYSRYDTPSGPPPGRDYERQEPQHQGYESGGGHGSGYSVGSDCLSQYGSQQGESRPQGPPSGYGRSQGNTPSGGFTASRDDGGDLYGSGRGGGGGGRPGGRDEPPRRGEADDYYSQQGQSGRGDRYTHLADIAHEHGDDPETYRKATQGLHEKIQSQAQNVRPGQNDDDDNQARLDAHRKAYGGDDHEPMNADAIGAAAAMEAFKQTAGAANKPSGGFMGGKPSGGPSSKPGPGAGQEVEEEEDGPADAGGRGLQDKLMALAMSHAGTLFDKKNSGSNTSGGGGGASGDKAQAMQSAAATAMQLFTQYQKKGKLDSGDMSLVMGLAKNLF